MRPTSGQNKFCPYGGHGNNNFESTKTLYLKPDDFEAVIRIYSVEEGGRKTPTFNGIRWDFAYAEPGSETLEIYMIWPDFYDESGDSLDRFEPLPIGVGLPARMLIINEERRDFHRPLLRQGTEFYCHEGPKRVAIGHVTRITGLEEAHSSSEE